jgi:hypothetical protein
MLHQSMMVGEWDDSRIKGMTDARSTHLFQLRVELDRFVKIRLDLEGGEGIRTKRYKCLDFVAKKSLYLPLLGSVVDAVFGRYNETGESQGMLRIVSARSKL